MDNILRRSGLWKSYAFFSTLTHIHLHVHAIKKCHRYHQHKTVHTDRLSPAAQTNQKYAVSCGVISFLLSLLVVFLHTRPLLSSIVLGTKIEGGAILVLLTLWSALVAIVSDTR